MPGYHICKGHISKFEEIFSNGVEDFILLDDTFWLTWYLVLPVTTHHVELTKQSKF